MGVNFLERLDGQVLLGDGGCLWELERRGWVQAGPYTPEVVVERPDAVREMHREFLETGADVLQALTFYADADSLHEVGRRDLLAKINRDAVRLAREVAGADAFVAGVVTQHRAFRRETPESARQVCDDLRRQTAILVEEGVDFCIGETFVFLEEAMLALSEMRAAGLVSMITLNMGPQGSREGISPAQCARRLVDAGADVVGVNCSYDPWTALDVARLMREVAPRVACQPVGFCRPGPPVPFVEWDEFPLALEPFLLSRFALADFAYQAREAGIAYIGGCCGVAPYHVRAMAEALGRRPAASDKSPNLQGSSLPGVRPRVDRAYWRNLTARGKL